MSPLLADLRNATDKLRERLRIKVRRLELQLLSAGVYSIFASEFIPQSRLFERPSGPRQGKAPS
jgi:hypothetical protein